MIHITNDFILRNLSDDTSYENALSKECFEPLVIRTSDEMKYIKSSTGLYLPVCQPNPTDVMTNGWGVDSTQWQWFANGTVTTQNHSCRAKYDAHGKPTSTINLGYTERRKDNYNYERRFGVAFPSSLSEYSANTQVRLEMINPDTKQYEHISLEYLQEYQRRKPGTTTRRNYPYRYHVIWRDENGNKKYIFESTHFNILEGEDYPVTGYALLAVPYFYMYADLAYDILNSEWVGILNLFLHLSSNDYNYVYFSEDDVYNRSFSYRIMEDTLGPFEGIATNSYIDICGINSGLFQLYRRAFKLDSEFALDIESKIISMNKIEIVGPNTRIAQ